MRQFHAIDPGKENHHDELTPCPCAGFIVRRTPLLGDVESLGSWYGSLFLEVGLVADNDHGDLVAVLDAENFFPQTIKLRKGRLRCDAEY